MCTDAELAAFDLEIVNEENARLRALDQRLVLRQLNGDAILDEMREREGVEFDPRSIDHVSELDGTEEKTRLSLDDPELDALISLL